ncbi:unnamed protein product, partial [Ilex paraguariensis]
MAVARSSLLTLIVNYCFKNVREYIDVVITVANCRSVLEKWLCEFEPAESTKVLRQKPRRLNVGSWSKMRDSQQRHGREAPVASSAAKISASMLHQHHPTEILSSSSRSIARRHQ